MKLSKLVLILLFLTFFNGYSQKEYKIDRRPQEQKENYPMNTDNIGLADLVEMLNFQGIEINKFKLGKFDKPYNIFIVADEYLNGVMITSDTITKITNNYHYFKSEKPFYDFIDQITIITKDSPTENESELLIKTYGVAVNKSLKMKNAKKEYSLHWRKYSETKWALNKKTPLLIHASAWLNKEDGHIKFCGPYYLKENEEATNELLKSSPNYVQISYIVSE